MEQTSWDKIDVEFLVEESKKLAKDIKGLNKAVRNYEVFRLLEEAVKVSEALRRVRVPQSQP